MLVPTTITRRAVGLFSMKRITIGKRLRFEIFARDGFTCKYCGRQSDVVPLQIDHVLPVCQGGTNDPENLVTACADCNAGKSGKRIIQHAPTEQDRLRLAQERAEQAQAFSAAKDSMKARQELRQSFIDWWCECTGRDDVRLAQFRIVFSFVEEFGPQTVMDWIEMAAGRTSGSDLDICKYVCGIRRNVLAAQEKQSDRKESDHA